MDTLEKLETFDSLDKTRRKLEHIRKPEDIGQLVHIRELGHFVAF